jgi:hypothetical protein
MTNKEKIVLFKSTARPEYKKLVLTALSAPVGTFFWTYYKEKYVSNDLIKRIKESSSSFSGKRAAIIFYNLNPNAGLKFYPLREFTIQKIESDGALKFYLCPGEYYLYTQEELVDFNKSICNEMPILPKMERSWVQLYFPECLNRLSKSTTPEERQKAWEKLVEYLDQPGIGEKEYGDFKESVFFRLDKLKVAGTEVKYTPETGFSLEAGKLYEWEGFFYKPSETNESFHVRLEANEEIVPITDQINILPGKNAPFKFEFRCKAIHNDKDLKIRIYSPEKALSGDAPYHEFPAKIAKLPLLKAIKKREAALVFFGLLINTIGPIVPTFELIKAIIVVAGSLITTFGIILLQRRIDSK